MFREIISDTAFTTRTADAMFPNINAEPFNGDVSFCATLRILLHNRIKEGENVYVRHRRLRVEKDALLNAIRFDDVDEGQEGTIRVSSVFGVTEYPGNEEIEKTFCEKNPTFRYVGKITRFFAGSFFIACFCDEAKKRVQIYVDSLSIQKLHCIECVCLAYLPWYFNTTEKLSDLELNLVKSLKETNSSAYKAALKEFEKQFDFKTAKIKTLLAGVEKKLYEAELETAKRNVEDFQARINGYKRNIHDLLIRMRAANIRIAGASSRLDGERENVIMDYFLHNNVVVLEDVTDGSITFTIITEFDFFDEDEARRALGNRNGIFYNCGITGFSHDDIKTLLWAIFVDRKVKVKTCASYTYELSGNVYGNSEHSYPAECDDCVPNGHIDRNRCIGDYEEDYIECIESGNHIGVFETAIASAKSIHLEETVSSDSSIEAIFNGVRSGRTGEIIKTKCVVLPDGRNVDAKEAIEWLKKEGESHE